MPLATLGPLEARSGKKSAAAALKRLISSSGQAILVTPILSNLAQNNSALLYFVTELFHQFARRHGS